PVNDGPATFTVRVRVDDGHGNVVTSAGVTLTVTNAVPTVGITGAPATSPEGTGITLTAAVTDPSAADTAAGFPDPWRVAPSAAGTALSFDGVNDYVQITRPVQDDFTLEAWIRTTTSLSGTQFFQGNGLLYADVPFVHNDFGTAILNGKFAFGTGNPDTTLLSTTPVTTGDWVHVAAVRVEATGTIQVFVNGVLEGSLATGNTSPLGDSAVLTIGGNVVDGRFFQGLIDEVRIW